MKRGDKVVKVIAGEEHILSYLGKGRYTTAFANERYVYSFTNMEDSSKDALSWRARDLPHVPQFIKVDEYEQRWRGQVKEIGVYRSPLYHKITPKAYPWLYKEVGRLDEARWALANEWYTHANRAEFDDIKWPTEVAQMLIDQTPMETSWREALQEILYAGMDYDSQMAFLEFHRPNIVADDNGEIVFLDTLCFLTRWGRFEKKR